MRHAWGMPMTADQGPGGMLIALGSWGDVAPVLTVAGSLRALGTASRVATASGHVGRMPAAALAGLSGPVG